MFIKSIYIKKDFRTLKAGTKINFDDKIMLIGGDNGVGKSSLLELIVGFIEQQTKKKFISDEDFESIIDIDFTEEYQESCNGVSMFRSDDNLKFLSYFKDDEMDTQIGCMKSSMGQSTLIQVFKKVMSCNKNIIILDEPDTSLSIKNVIVLKKILKFISAFTENQIIIVAHSFHFINNLTSDNSIFDLESSTKETIPNYMSKLEDKAQKEYDIFLKKQGMGDIIEEMKKMREMIEERKKSS